MWIGEDMALAYLGLVWTKGGGAAHYGRGRWGVQSLRRPPDLDAWLDT